MITTKPIITMALNGINGAGQHRIMAVEVRNGVGPDMPKVHRTGRSKIIFSKLLTGQDEIISPSTG